ncbi:MAG: MFS transporter [Pseudomonadota bacterium]|nr:MFS transporter [Pseudomonadota bacterium]
MPNAAFRNSIRLLGTRRFGTFWFASLLANIGTWSQQVAQPWLLLSLGASPFLLGLDAFALGAPVLLLTLVGGALADHGDRRRIIAVFQSIQMLCPVLLVVLLLTGTVQPWVVIVLSLVVGITDALSMPSYQSIVPSIVEREQIPSGIALNTTQFNLSRILGPALAGILMASVGLAGAFAVSAASYLPFILVALWILPRSAPGQLAASGLDRHKLWAGVREVVHEPGLRGALLTVFLTSLLCAPLITFSPVLVKEVFQGGAGQFSTAMGAFGLGGLVGAIGLLAVHPQHDRRPISTWFAAAYSIIVVLAALNPWAWGLPALLVLAGITMTASNASANALLQSSAPVHIRGQSVSLFMLAMRGGMALGSLVTGASVHLLGVQHALLLNGVIALLAHLALGRVWLKVPLRS